MPRQYRLGALGPIGPEHSQHRKRKKYALQPHQLHNNERNGLLLYVCICAGVVVGTRFLREFVLKLELRLGLGHEVEKEVPGD